MIRPMTKEERGRAMERNAINSSQRAKREDGLVKRLRNGDEFEKVMSAGQAADRIEQLAATNEELSNCVAVLEQQLRISETIREAVSEGRDKTFARMQTRIEQLAATNEELSNYTLMGILLEGEDRG